MLKSKERIRLFSIAFIAVELVFSLAVHTVSGRPNDFVSVGAIVLACLFAALFSQRNGDYLLVQLGLVCTVLADVFLLILEPREQLIAMLFFSVTQICYFIRLFLWDKKHRAAHLAVRIMITLVALLTTCLVLGDRTDQLSLVSLFYFANLTVNAVWAFIEFKTSRLFGPGLVLFLLCDICVGLSVMSADYIPVAEGSLLYFLINPGFNLAWVFYIPAQVLIALSLAEKATKEKV
ncbi:MAG: hypothetical protein IKJ13_02560 [Clostridia bacterium]|nr:hypothetical protein [Clostridia bacterium]